MSKEPHNSFFSNALANAVGGIIVLAIVWFTGVLPKLWTWFMDACSSILSIANKEISLNVGSMVILLLLLFAGGYILRWLTSRTAKIASVPSESVTNNTEPPINILEAQEAQPVAFSDIEIEVIRVLAVSDGAWLNIFRIADTMKSRQLIVEQAIESLQRRGMLKDAISGSHGRTYRLSAVGRDYAIGAGFVR